MTPLRGIDNKMTGPFGMLPSSAHFRVVGTFEAGFYDHDVRLASLFCERVFGTSAQSAIVAVPGEAAYERLSAGNVTVSRRAGAARLSFHLYNTEDDALRAARLVAGR